MSALWICELVMKAFTWHVGLEFAIIALVSRGVGD